MKSNTPCITATVANALVRLPGPNGERFASIFQHGSLHVEIYAPRGVDSLHTPVMKSISSSLAAGNMFAAKADRDSIRRTFCLQARA